MHAWQGVPLEDLEILTEHHPSFCLHYQLKNHKAEVAGKKGLQERGATPLPWHLSNGLGLATHTHGMRRSHLEATRLP